VGERMKMGSDPRYLAEGKWFR